MASALGGTYGNIVDVWNPNTGQVVFTFYGQSSDAISSLSWSPDGRYIASTDFNGTVDAWDSHTGRIIFTERVSEISRVVWSPHDMILAFTSNNGRTIRVWNVATNAEVSRYNAPGILDLAWSPDGKEIASANGHNVIIWDAGTGQTIYTFTKQNVDVVQVAWSPDGKYIVSGTNFSGLDKASTRAMVWVA